MAVYFASDVHLGLNYQHQSAKVIERRFINWLCSIESDCEELYLVGDIFDFWYEWRRVVPRGSVRTLGKLASMCDRGIKIHLFVGNHDLWQNDYFEQELGLTLHHSPFETVIQGKSLYIAHGDNLGKRDFGGRLLSSTFRSRFARWAFSKFVHPNCAMRFGLWWSSSSRHSRGGVDHQFRGENEYLVRYARSIPSHNYFVFGHLHTPTLYPLASEEFVVVLGQWIERPVYGRMENGVISLLEFNSSDCQV